VIDLRYVGRWFEAAAFSRGDVENVRGVERRLVEVGQHRLG
jgi:hypothetical protein